MKHEEEDIKRKRQAAEAKLRIIDMHGFSVTGPVYPAAGRGSTVTVEKLRVTPPPLKPPQQYIPQPCAGRPL